MLKINFVIFKKIHFIFALLILILPFFVVTPKAKAASKSHDQPRVILAQADAPDEGGEGGASSDSTAGRDLEQNATSSVGQEGGNTQGGQATPANNAPIQNIFTAVITKVLQEQRVVDQDGTLNIQQNLEMRVLDGRLKGKTVEYNGIGDPESLSKNQYKIGEKVSVEETADANGNVKYFITDYVRTDSLMWLAIVFVISLLIVGRWKGFRSLLSLVLSFVVIMKYILPQIMDGADPVITTLIGSFGILLMVIYVTDGFNRASHISVLSIFLSLAATIGLSYFFVNLTRLTGLANEEVSFLIGNGNQIVNFKGLLLAGIIIGALGVLDDVVIAQITAVEEISENSSGQSRMEIFNKAMKIGISHISAMTNTLFLAYAGASLPLLILFLTGQSAFASASQALNNEALATEVVRTLAGSIGLILSLPLSTFFAVLWIKKN